MASRTWRQRAAPLIRETIAEHRGSGEKAVRAALREAYPFGPREYHPYKVWLDEIKRQMAEAFPELREDLGAEGLPLFDPPPVLAEYEQDQDLYRVTVSQRGTTEMEYWRVREIRDGMVHIARRCWSTWYKPPGKAPARWADDIPPELRDAAPVGHFFAGMSETMLGAWESALEMVRKGGPGCPPDPEDLAAVIGILEQCIGRDKRTTEQVGKDGAG